MQTHLGPDGTTDYMCSIAECVDALYREFQRMNPSTRAIMVAWDAKSQETTEISGNILEKDPFWTNDTVPARNVGNMLSWNETIENW